MALRRLKKKKNTVRVDRRDGCMHNATGCGWQSGNAAPATAETYGIRLGLCVSFLRGAYLVALFRRERLSMCVALGTRLSTYQAVLLFGRLIKRTDLRPPKKEGQIKKNCHQKKVLSVLP